MWGFGAPAELGLSYRLWSRPPRGVLGHWAILDLHRPAPALSLIWDLIFSVVAAKETHPLRGGLHVQRVQAALQRACVTERFREESGKY